MNQKNYSINSIFGMVLLLTIEFILAIAIGLGLLHLGADGGSWILGGTVAGALAFYGYRSHFGSHASPNRTARKIGQLLVGLSVGFSVHQSDFTGLLPHLPIFILLTGVVLGCGGLIGYIYARLTQIDFLSALLATIPGNVGVMASIAADYGRNTSQVSLVQLMRFTAVTFFIPMIANGFIGAVPAQSNPFSIERLLPPMPISNGLYGGLLLLSLALAAIATLVGQSLKIPVAALLCSIVVGMGFDAAIGLVPGLSAATDFSLPPLLTLVGQILLGITIGEYWAINPPAKIQAIAVGTVPVIMTILGGVIAASLARLLTPWDWLTCLLVTAPGGSPEMIWLALVLNHDVEIVTIGHLLRLVAINATLPFVITLVHHLETRTQPLPMGLRPAQEQGDQSLQELTRC